MNLMVSQNDIEGQYYMDNIHSYVLYGGESISIMSFLKIGWGSVVLTSKANYFLSISAGQLEVGNAIFFAISPNTPIGLLLMGKTVDNEVSFREQRFMIETIF